MRGRTGRATRPWGRIAVVLAAAAILAAVGLTHLLRGPGLPVAEFGALPLPGASLAPTLGGASGPGFTFELEYELGGELNRWAAALPDRAAAYRRLPIAVTKEYLAAVAFKLGITGPIEREGWHDGHILVVDPGEGAPSLRMYPVGYIVYSRQDYDHRALERAELPEDIRAVAAAREWLVSSSMVIAGELGEGTVTADLEIGVLFVRFAPIEPGEVLTLAPWAQVEMGVGEVVVTGSAVWPGADAQSPYPLRSLSAAWADVEVSKAMLSWQVTEYTGPADDEGVVRGTVTITGARLAWALAASDQGTLYLVPAYAFSGTADVVDGEGVTQLPFLAWVSAVSAEHQAR